MKAAAMFFFSAASMRNALTFGVEAAVEAIEILDRKTYKQEDSPYRETITAIRETLESIDIDFPRVIEEVRNSVSNFPDVDAERYRGGLEKILSTISGFSSRLSQLVQQLQDIMGEHPELGVDPDVLTYIVQNIKPSSFAAVSAFIEQLLQMAVSGGGQQAGEV